MEEEGFVSFTAKGAKERRLPLHLEVEEALGAWRARCPDPEWVFPSPRRIGRPMSVSTLHRMIKDVGAMAGVPTLHAHQWRHTFATQLLRGGASLRTVQEALGHSNLQTTATYLKIEDPEFEGDIRGFKYSQARRGTAADEKGEERSG